jgi:hypothetical protein
MPGRPVRGMLVAASLAASLAMTGVVATGCGPSADTVKTNAQQARRAVDDVVYYDVELLLVPTVVMRTTEVTVTATPKQTVQMKAWLAKDLAIIEQRAKTVDHIASAPALGDPSSDELLQATSQWLDGVYVPTMRRAVDGVVAGQALGAIQTSLGAPWVGAVGEKAKARIAALRSALAKKAGQ